MTVRPQGTQDMLSWGPSDTDQGHEVGHMLGNKEEYFTVDGIPHGPGRQPSGNIMNNPANPPVAAHYQLINGTADQLLGSSVIAGRAGAVKPVA